MLFVFINERRYVFKKKMSILEACKLVGIKIPRFCFHENLSIAGNCRMCLVEINKVLKPVIACATGITNNIFIRTKSPLVLKARENILEILLLNHPLDCPICDQGGECDLQDQATFFGRPFSRGYINKRGVEDKNCGPLIKTVMTRCIHCTRCVRFGEEVCGIKFFGTINRGSNLEITNYLLQLTISEISANVIDLCPVGALTLKSVPFQIRSWEFSTLESIDLSDSLGSNIYITYKNLNVFKVSPKKNILINESWISNKARFYYNLVSFDKPLAHNVFKRIGLQHIPALCLVNADLDLETFYLLNRLKASSSVSCKVLNSTAKSTNFHFWGHKCRIVDFKTAANILCFMVSTDLNLEAPLLNTRLRAKIYQNEVSIASVGSHFKSTFPIKFTRFSVAEFIFLFLGKHPLFSFVFLKKQLLVFTNKSILDRIDSYLFLHIKAKVPNLLYYCVYSFCNSAAVNLLNFSSFNLKEFKFSKLILAICLDDTFFIRKFIAHAPIFFWVNFLPSSILSLLPLNSWLPLHINQLPGVYLNFEQRPQKMRFLNIKYPFSTKSLLYYLNALVRVPAITFYFKSQLAFSYNIVLFSGLHEVLLRPLLFDFKALKLRFFFMSYFFALKRFPLKLLLEDPYRASLFLKVSIPLIKSSQLLRTHGALYFS